MTVWWAGRLAALPPLSGGQVDRDNCVRTYRGKQYPPRHSDQEGEPDKDCNPLEWVESDRPGAETPSKFCPRAGFETTIRDYLTEQLAGDSDQSAVLALADTFLAQGGQP